MTKSAGCASRLADDNGSIAPLAIIYAVIALAAGLMLFAAADLYLERKQLFTHADAAALAAANTFELEDIELAGGAPTVSLDRDRAFEAAQSHLSVHGNDDTRLDDLVIVDDTVTLRIQGEWRPFADIAFVALTVPVEVEVSARARLE